MKRRSSRVVSLENALDDEPVEVLMRIEQRAKIVDESLGARGNGPVFCSKNGPT